MPEHLSRSKLDACLGLYAIDFVKTWRTRVVNACGPKSLKENWENKASAAENNMVKLHKISAETGKQLIDQS